MIEMNKLLLAATGIVGLGIAYYFLYQYNYNEAKDAMSMVVPDMLAYGQEAVITLPSRQTHGDILFIGANDTLGGIFECGKNLQLNDVKTEECENRLPVEGDFFGPHFTAQNMSYIDNKTDIYL